jgi:carboxyl-terminal processing protease
MKRLLLLIFVIAISGCADSLVAPQVDTTPPAVSHELWNEFALRYPNFDSRHVNWDSLGAYFSARITPSTVDTDLILALDSLLMSLHDGHVSLSPINAQLPRNVRLRYENTDSMQEFTVHTVSQYYLGETANISSSGKLVFGRIFDTIGYIHISGFDETEGETLWQSEVDSVLQSLWNTKAMIVDVRGNIGGEAYAETDFASRFTQISRIFLYTQERYDHVYTDLSAPQPEWLNPRGATWSKPVVLLTDRFCISAGEWFTLAMKTLPNVTTIGDTTQGAFSGRLDRELSNGWLYSMAFQKNSDANHVCHEGVGLIPDIEVYIPPRIAFPGDTVLRRALQFLAQ